MSRAAVPASALSALAFALAALSVAPASALNNGFVLPGLYWSTWNHFGGAIGDALLRECADAMVSSGLRDAGYLGINLDDGAFTSLLLHATRAPHCCAQARAPDAPSTRNTRSPLLRASARA